MINKRLINTSKKSLNYVFEITFYQIISMLLNIALIFQIASFFDDIYNKSNPNYIQTIVVYAVVITFRSLLKKKIAKLGVLASSEVKVNLRTLIYKKILNIGGKYTEKISTAEVTQVASEGVEQLEMYFASYLPQFFYCMTAPIILFGILSFISFKASFVLFLCVPLIPISIVIVQKIAKKLLAKYWGIYTSLGDDFLENVQGMTSLKIYGADEHYHKEMNKSAENFRKITMKVLTMQLNSIIIMDIVAYGGASLGAIMAIKELQNGSIEFFGAVVIILLASEFFLPMRLLGSFFHIAMNGMSASKKMFKILDLEEKNDGIDEVKTSKVEFENVTFSYDGTKEILKNISFEATRGLTSIVGVSGSGKSTISSLIVSKLDAKGVKIGENEILKISRKSLFEHITRVTDKGYIFEGTVRSNLMMACENASDDEMISVLKKANVWALFEKMDKLDTKILERGSNLSGGEKQRLNIARALLKDSEIYIFDEVTSNIDAESEDDIMKVILELAKFKTVILISHRLQNVVSSDNILMLKDGEIKEKGTHDELLEQKGEYATLFLKQKELEEVRS